MKGEDGEFSLDMDEERMWFVVLLLWYSSAYIFQWYTYYASFVWLLKYYHRAECR